MDQRLLIIGATTRLGREVIKLCAATSRFNLRVLLHRRSKPEILLSDALEVIRVSVTDSESISRSMNNVDRLIVIPPNTRNQSAWEDKIYREASRARVKHIVKLSTAKADRHSPCYFFREHALAEEHLRKCGVPFTIVRSNSFMQNLVWFAAEVRSKGTLSLPMGDAEVAPVDIRDVARVIAAIATDPINNQDVLNVTGPEKLTFAQMTDELSHAASCHIRYRDIGTRQFTQTLKLSGQSAWHADAILAAWMVARNGQPVITDLVTKITKRQCVSIKMFAREYAFHFNETSRSRYDPRLGTSDFFNGRRYHKTARKVVYLELYCESWLWPASH